MDRLGHQVKSTTARAASRGALVTLPTERRVVRDGGIPFIVHVSTLQESKRRAKIEQRARRFNPFLPCDPDLVVRDVAPAHTAVLNKFNVIPEHLLIVTRRFEPQDSLLTLGDMTALTVCMAEIDGLGFYNGGKVAGASQEHKHLQLVPLPLGDGPLPTPLDAVLQNLPVSTDAVTVGPFDFAHVLVPLGDQSITPNRARELHRAYLRGCAELGVVDESQPYNLLVTRRWMLVVPRRRELWNRISINALGFAGSLLVRNEAELDALAAAGPLEVLRTVVDRGAIRKQNEQGARDEPDSR